MPDLKAAAKRLKKLSDKKSLAAMRNGSTPKAFALANESWDYFLAVQVLEALVWQEEVGARVMHYPLTDQWTCETLNGKYYADTPLGAVLAAREGETDGEA